MPDTEKEVDSFLAHHGILGMHWGIRRFQNEDGTYTKAGKERRNNDEEGTPTPDSYSGDSVASTPPLTKAPREQIQERTPEQKRALLLAGAGVVAAATIIGVSVYNEKHSGETKKLLNTMSDVKLPKIDVDDDSKIAEKAASALLEERNAEKKLAEYVQKGADADPQVAWILADNYEKAIDAAKSATSKKEELSKFVAKNKDVIVNDPKLIRKYESFLSTEDLVNATNKTVASNNLAVGLADKAKRGAMWMGVATAYGTAAAGLANLQKFPDVPGAKNVGTNALKMPQPPNPPQAQNNKENSK